MNILIADDHPVVRAGLRVVLEARSAWHICGEAGSGDEMVQLANKLQPDIVVVDYALPVLNGVEAIRQIKRAAPKAKTLVYTMYDDDLLIREAAMVGARGYALKSADNGILVDAVAVVARGGTYFPERVQGWLRPELLDGRPIPQLLTTRERAVVQLVAEGASNKAIADRWGVSIKTIETQRTSAMKKLGLRSAVEVARYAIRNKLIQP